MALPATTLILNTWNKMILVLTTPRTGSTWFCEHLAREQSLENLDEYFGSHTIGVDEQLAKLEYLKHNKNVVLKCFPWHIKNIRTNFKRVNFLENNLFKLADKIYILVRSNFTDQCKSYYLAKTTNVWSGVPQEHQAITVDQTDVDYCVNHLIDGYTQLAEYNKLFNCELVDYDKLNFDFNTKYVRPITWLTEPVIPSFDVKSLFT